MSDETRVPDRVRCLVCTHFLGSHDGETPFPCRVGGCGCRVFVAPPEVPHARD